MSSSRKRRIHVVLAIRTLSGAGAELVVETLARGLNPDRFQVTLCEGVGRGEKGDRLRADGFDVVSLVPGGNPKNSYFNPVRLAQLVWRRKVDLVHSHSATSLADAALCRLASRRLKLIHTFHFGNYPNVEPTTARLERTFGMKADARVAVGGRQAIAIRQTYGWAADDIVTVWNGVRPRPARIDRNRTDGLRSEGRPVVGVIGTLIEQKGHTDLFEAILLLRQRGVEAHYAIVGGGRLRQELEDRSRQLGIDDCVTFLGWVQDAAATVLPAMDLVVQPSRWEAMSMVLLEAALVGLPIVCTDVGEASALFEHGTEALIVPPRDPRLMADALSRLIGNAGLRQTLGAAARRKVMSACSVDAMIGKYERLYETTAGVLTQGLVRMPARERA